MQNIGLLRLENRPSDDAPELVVAAEPAVLKCSPEDRFCSVAFTEQVDKELLAAGAPRETAPVAEAVPPRSKGRRSDKDNSPRRDDGNGTSDGGGWAGFSPGFVSKVEAAASAA